MCGDSQPSQPTEQKITQSNLPEYLQPYVTDLARRAQAVSNQGYVPYKGQRIAGFDPLQNQAFNQAKGMQAKWGEFGGDTAANYLSPYGVSVNDANKWGEFGQDDAKRYMNPYQQAVTDTAIRKMQQQAQANMATAGLKGAMSGGYGSSGNAIMDAMTARTLQQDVGDRQAQDRAAAYLNAQQMFGQDRQYYTNAMQNAQQMFGADRANAYQNIQQLQGLGGLRQGLGQKKYDMAYADFLRQRDYPKEQLGFYSNIVRGLPQQMGSTALTYAQQPSVAQMLTGAGITGLGAAKYGAG